MAPLPTYVNPANADETKDVAMDLLQARDVEMKTFAADKIPEKVTIGRLSDRFEPANTAPWKDRQCADRQDPRQQAGRLFSQ